MSQVVSTTHVFAGEKLEVVTVVDENGIKWFLANPFARILGYSNTNKAIRVHVSDENGCILTDLRSAHNGLIENHALHPRSKFINQAGIFELINCSKMPKAQEFRQWVNSDLLPKLCDNGIYDMVQDAPNNIQQAMNTVHQVTNEGASASWATNNEIEVLRLKLELSEQKGKYEREISLIKLEFQERENKYQHMIKDLTVQANMTLTQFGLQGLLARDNIADNDELRSNLRAVKDRVIPEMSTCPEKEHFVVGYEYETNGRKRMRVTRNQRVEIDKRDKIIQHNLENPTKKICIKQYPWLADADKIFQVKCPNAISLWIKIRELQPHKCYGFKFTNRARTEIEFLDEDEIREKYRADVIMCEKNEKCNEKLIEYFQSLKLEDEDDAVKKCVTPTLEAKEQFTTTTTAAATITTTTAAAVDLRVKNIIINNTRCRNFRRKCHLNKFFYAALNVKTVSPDKKEININVVWLVDDDGV
nr:hypothetical protein [Microctonus hyperodae filamentous virus]